MGNEEKKDAAGAISRRDLLKVITIAPAAAMVPVAPAVAAALQTPAETTAQTSAAYAPKVFNAHAWKTLQVLCDLIIPADERSGSATQAGVPAFIDDWLQLKGGQLKTEVLGGLIWMDVECNRLSGQDFADASTAQQKQILDRVAYPATAAPEDANAVAAFNHIRDLVLGGFYSSKMGIEDLQYMGNKVLPSWDGCPEEATSRLGVDYSNWKNWRT